MSYVNNSFSMQRRVLFFFQNRPINFEQRLNELCIQTRLLKQEWRSPLHPMIFHAKVNAWAYEARALMSMHTIFKLNTAQLFQIRLENKLPKLIGEEAHLRAQLLEVLPIRDAYFENAPLSTLLFDSDGHLKNLENRIYAYETGLGSLHIVLPYIIDPYTLFFNINPNSLHELAESMKYYWHSTFYCL